MVRYVARSFSLLLVITACSSSAPTTGAKVPESAVKLEPATIANSEVTILKSQFVSHDFRISIARPIVPATADTAGVKYPVIYVLDANSAFGTVTETARMGTFGNAEIPPAIVVGIGYPPSSTGQSVTFRAQDYTPTGDTAYVRYSMAISPGGQAAAPGGAGAFLRFIREELKPYIEKHYPADPADATLVGHSLGGLFATYALFHRPDTFRRYVISSPSLWWDRRVSFQLEKEYAAKHADLAADVFISAGGLEVEPEFRKEFARFPEPMRSATLHYYGKVGFPQMVELVEPFAKIIAGRGYSSLRITSYIFPDENHLSVMPMSMSRGLRAVFGGGRD